MVKVPIQDERGMVAVTMAILLVALLSFAALAVDLSSLFLVRNELQNAADGGALAGARDLYQNSGEAINTRAVTGGQCRHVRQHWRRTEGTLEMVRSLLHSRQ